MDFPSLRFSSDLVKWVSVYLCFATGFAIACYLLIREQWINPWTLEVRALRSQACRCPLFCALFCVCVIPRFEV